MASYLKRAAPQAAAERAGVSETVAKILTAVRTRGETAVREFSAEFDQWNPPRFRVSAEQLADAAAQVPEAIQRDLLFCQEQIRQFARSQRQSLSEFTVETHPGILLGQKHIPVSSVGCYVPGGRYPLVASAAMSIITAKEAGVPRVVACTPPGPGGAVPAALLYAMQCAGADEVYVLGGVQALAALAYGTDEIHPVDLIVGPGNRYVAEAKRQLFGTVGIDLPAGPTEVLLLAETGADPELLAADLLAQCEHDPDAVAVLITTDPSLGVAAQVEISRQLAVLETQTVAGQAWERNGEIAIVADREAAAALADQYAPEHLHVHGSDLDWYLARLHNYGSLFLGEETTVPYGDKSIGTNHILPTGRAARYTGGLWVGKFLKTVTYQRLTRAGSLRFAAVTARQCQLEHMVGHAHSARLRAEKFGAKGGPA